MIETYLAQLETAAAAHGVDLAKACDAEGVAGTTLRRWRNGDFSPRQNTVERIMARIVAMARKAPR